MGRIIKPKGPVEEFIEQALAFDLATKYEARVAAALQEAIENVAASEAEVLEFEKHGKHYVTEGRQREFFWKGKLILVVTPIEKTDDDQISFQIEKRWKEFAKGGS